MSKLYRVDFSRDGRKLVAALDDSGLWHCEDSQIAEFLNEMLSPKKDYSPTTGPFGYQHAVEAALLLRGRLTDVTSGEAISR